MKLWVYAAITTALIVVVSVLIAGQSNRNEKELLSAHNELIRALQKEMKADLGDSPWETVTDTLEWCTEDSNLCAHAYKFFGEKRFHYFHGRTLIATETTTRSMNFVKREYYRADSTRFAIAYSVYGTDAIVTFYDAEERFISDLRQAVPPYWIYVLY